MNPPVRNLVYDTATGSPLLGAALNTDELEKMCNFPSAYGRFWKNDIVRRCCFYKH